MTWEPADGSDYENTEFETYDFTPVWDDAAYTLAEGLTGWDIPFITVNIAGMENPNTKDITTAEALKTALENTTPATISVTEDINPDRPRRHYGGREPHPERCGGKNSHH